MAAHTMAGAPSAEGTAALSGEAAPGTDPGEGGEREDGRRRGRNRDRSRRERRPDEEQRSAGEDGSAELAAEATTEPARPAAMPAPASVAAAVAVAPPAPAVVVPFVLAIGELEAVAQGSGLQWVNSDATKITDAQDAIAAEPKPIHVPRERKPLVAQDVGPLVLVETRKDLSQLKLPFEQSQSQPAA